MRSGICLGAILVLASHVGAQVPNPNLVCLSLNDAGTPPANLIQLSLQIGGQIDVEFTLATSLSVDGFDFYIVNGFYGAGPEATLHQVSSGGFGPVMAGGAVTAQAPGTYDWQTVQFPALTLVAGVTYGIRMRMTIGNICDLTPIGADPAGTSPMNCSVSYAWPYPPCTIFPTPTVAPVMLRFRGAACGLGASTTSVGYPCGGPLSPHLTSTNPGIGSLLSITVNAPTAWPTSPTMHLFWSLGVNAAGSAIGGTGCQTYLDLPSLYALSLAGLEPLVSGVGSGGVFNVVTWTVGLPYDPGLVGIGIGIQVLTVDTSPNGIPFGNVFINTSNARLLTLGY